MRHKGEQRLIYNIKTWRNKGDFDILNEISENVTLVQLTNTIGNVNHDISIVGYCIFDSNYRQALFLIRESLDIIFSPSFVEEQFVNFETVFYTVRYMWSPGNLNIG